MSAELNSEAMLNSGIYLIQMAGSSVADTQYIEQAITTLKDTLYMRQNLPF